MNKSVILASAVLCAAVSFADDHADITATASGYYDVTLTTKRLAHSEKTITKTFTTKYAGSGKSRYVTSYAFEQFVAEYKKVCQLAGFELISAVADGKIVVDPETQKCYATRIVFKYSYYDFKEVKHYVGTGRSRELVRIDTNYVTKIVSESYKGIYDPEGDEAGAAKAGMVYLWNSAYASKISVTNGMFGAIVESKKDRQGVEQKQTGFVAYQVPLAMHKQFVGTQDNKSAGGFTGGFAEAENGQVLDFNGFTAFGTGTLDTKTSDLKTVAGNVAMKNPEDTKFGAYGTWRIQQNATLTTKFDDIKSVLRNKGCVELFMEKEDK